MTGNREIYNTSYSAENLRLAPKNAYEREIIAVRASLVDEYAPGRDVLDLCCGAGSYLIPALGKVRSATGLDFSSKMLEAFMQNLGGPMPSNLSLIEADAERLPFNDASFDFVFSFTSLYYLPDVCAAVREVGRVLRPGGTAALETGNSSSINAWFANWQHRNRGFARVHCPPLHKIYEAAAVAGLGVARVRSFQLLPMYDAPKKLIYMYPVLAPAWKTPLGVKLGGRMLDEILSSSALLRRFAFRHIFILEKRG